MGAVQSFKEGHLDYVTVEKVVCNFVTSLLVIDIIKTFSHSYCLMMSVSTVSVLFS